MSCQTNWQMSYLKFASPVLDESTIAGVGDVLRSGNHLVTRSDVADLQRDFDRRGRRSQHPRGSAAAEC